MKNSHGKNAGTSGNVTCSDQTNVVGLFDLEETNTLRTILREIRPPSCSEDDENEYTDFPNDWTDDDIYLNEAQKELTYHEIKAICSAFRNLGDLKARERLVSLLPSNNKQLSARVYLKLLFATRNINEETLKKIIDRLRSLPQDRGKVASFYDLLFKIPYGIIRPVNSQIEEIEDNLGKAIFGMKDAKQQVSEYIVMQRHSDGKAMPTPLLLVSKPGLGKTAFASALANALGLPFGRVSFAGNFEVSMFRGMNMGWMSSSPGCLLKELSRVGCENPVILLDEIDKAGGASSGNVIDVLTEILDPNQSAEFMDTYMEIPIDLSKVMFICTANNLDNIPNHITDRCAVINISPYNREDKKKIIMEYMPEQLKKELRISYDIRVDSRIADKLAELESMRQIKAALKRHVAQYLKNKKPGEVKVVFVREVIGSLMPNISENKGREIGFMR
jgi:ATP-dependent Lon protease